MPRWNRPPTLTGHPGAWPGRSRLLSYSRTVSFMSAALSVPLPSPAPLSLGSINKRTRKASRQRYSPFVAGLSSYALTLAPVCRKVPSDCCVAPSFLLEIGGRYCASQRFHLSFRPESFQLQLKSVSKILQGVCVETWLWDCCKR